MPAESKAGNQSQSQFAAQQASLWGKGLADWGQDAARIRRLKDAAEFAIYTPGSSAGIPVSILNSFDAPGRPERVAGCRAGRRSARRGSLEIPRPHGAGRPCYEAENSAGRGE
jgi:hypothetical protein